MSAAGQCVPPMLIFPQKRWQNELIDGAPPGSIGACSGSGWITFTLFSKWLEHFINIVKPIKERIIVLILDGHCSHTRNLDVIDRAREVGISIAFDLIRRIKCSHWMYHSYFRSKLTMLLQLKTGWHPNRIVKKLQISSLFGETYNRAATVNCSKMQSVAFARRESLHLTTRFYGC